MQEQLPLSQPGVKVLRNGDLDVRAGHPPRSTRYQWMGQGLYPKPRVLGPRTVVWLESEIVAWEAARFGETTTGVKSVEPPASTESRRRGGLKTAKQRRQQKLQRSRQRS